MSIKTVTAASCAATFLVLTTGCGQHAALGTPGAVSSIRVVGQLRVVGGVLYQGRDGRGNPMAGVVRWVNVASGQATTVKTTKAGRYHLSLPPGTYRVSGGNGTGWPVGSCTTLSTPPVGTVHGGFDTNPVTLATGSVQSIDVDCQAA